MLPSRAVETFGKSNSHAHVLYLFVPVDGVGSNCIEDRPTGWMRRLVYYFLRRGWWSARVRRTEPLRLAKRSTSSANRVVCLGIPDPVVVVPDESMREQNMIERKKLAIVGGGPKAVAIAAKAAVLNALNLAQVEVTIFESEEIGSHWTGRNGYTDGEQALCTPAERDLGFPYNSPWESVSADLHAQYSWASFKIDRTAGGYQSWVDRGRLRPRHSEFAAYLQWAAKRTEADIQKVRVDRLVARQTKWNVLKESTPGVYVSAHGDAKRRFDGVVITGPGAARRVPLQADLHPLLTARVHDGLSFWKNLETVEKQLKDGDPSDAILVIGGGGTGAAVLAWLVRHGYGSRPLILVADQATLFSRGDSVFENALFSDQAAWERLSPENRDHFFNRLNRGVVWHAVMEDLAEAQDLVLMDARAKEVIDDKGDLGVEIRKWDGSTETLPAALVVDASGFDPWWFSRLLPSVRWGAIRKRRLAQSMAQSLTFTGSDWTLPPLHVPFLGSKLGPGFGSLMCLGAMSDLVLSDYALPPGLPGA
ncbi:SidA/IucD/PvdA family monooxygenase [Paraburkholderia sp. SIMBA_030]|uniref:SidA/IucD/PvdA family monooxygenase n=1 Tax=Paraburkholderia sp. SIMBA_030 TaxID=3085773 RepID=UPI00397823C8